MSVEITINTENAAFDKNEGPEVARILRKAAMALENYPALSGDDSCNLRDLNGNRVGRLEVTK